MRQYLVTGGAGFIGSHIVQALLEGGNAVRVLDNFSTGRRENLQEMEGRLEVLEGDLRDPARVRQAVQGVEVIFHEAAFVSNPKSLQEPQSCFEVNVQGTVTLFEAARLAGVQRIVLASSAAVYGDSRTLPLSEDTPLQPLSPYAASKQINEIYARLYTQAFDLPAVALRYFNVYGPRQSPETEYAAAIPIFIHQLIARQSATIFGDGGQTRDFIYVGDVVRANLIAAEHPQAPGQVFNICTGQEIKIIDLLTTLRDLVPDPLEPVFAPPRPGDILRSVGDPARAATTLGFRAQTRLADGLRQTMEWMRQ
ncbi:MAG: SDR family oxidoreductase [Chloroflexi bacterium]|nr:SDR family oxidoreductase [Chloroflexota bacterium]